ncbi:dihydrodipicolinate synthase family protein [Sulfolobus sp. E1]|uniref:dihydrodipicolinate synthase family protein n=1 Tax=Saccharolobus sp. A20 TaxID=1891280 RepID=UPI000845D191|nr:dihydrodipicolinate synthase family protein [Sulfolobus sp. A20]TRM74854.1 dihydrodipicolinate synthase family protein [Sulfolobus sp. A20-N-F8]TRM79503.1 dihydrodipicolinate synthase family protein [Sulfolobus sp. B5]TRM99297.1 dihydrodipicolinate synthase family protein [Sulfolobus sp. E1]TRN04088.1 dihydrodipicolinate synthase family protein [Sulfolobus sp. F1]
MEGVFLTNITPFNKNLELDIQGLRNIISYAENVNMRYIVPLGTAGEFSSLSIEERVKVVENVVKSVNKSEVIAGASSTSYVETGNLCKKYRDLGVKRVMLTPPYYLKGNHEGIIEYFKLVSSLCEMDIVIYNNPSVINFDLSPNLIYELVREVPSIKALKEARYNVVEFKEVVRLVGSKIDVIDGLEERALLGMILGAKGFTTSMGSFSSLPIKIYESYVRGEYERAFKLYDLLLEYRSIIKPPITMAHLAKLGAELKGLISSSVVRPPLPQLSDEQRKQALKIIQKILAEFN